MSMQFTRSLPENLGIVIVDHGSKFEAANDMLLEVAARFKEDTGARIVEPAHMELAEPTMAGAFRRCIEQGAERIVVHPYFLSPGRHSTTDIPAMAEEAARKYGNIPYTVTDPLGLDDGMTDIILRRIHQAMASQE